MSSVTYSSPYPIVFICDLSNEHEEIPDYNPSAVASSTDSCISIRTVSEIDGEVTVFLERDLASDVVCAATEVYSGSIDAPGRRVAVVDSENNPLLESDEVGTRAFIRVLVDDEKHPSKIWIEAR